LNSGGGNIAPFTPRQNPSQFFLLFIRSRQFPRAGRFPWHSTKTGVSGTVVVE
jgi:hypothetical protein